MFRMDVIKDVLVTVIELLTFLHVLGYSIFDNIRLII